MAYSANQTKFLYKDAAAANFTEIQYLMEIPELGALPEKVDVTTLSDPVKKYVPGIKDYGDLVFKFLYENKDAASNYKIFKTLEDAGKTATFQIKYPDNTLHQFDAIPAVKMDAGTVNGALTFSVTMLLQSDITNPNE